MRFSATVSPLTMTLFSISGGSMAQTAARSSLRDSTRADRSSGRRDSARRWALVKLMAERISPSMWVMSPESFSRSGAGRSSMRSRIRASGVFKSWAMAPIRAVRLSTCFLIRACMALSTSAAWRTSRGPTGATWGALSSKLTLAAASEKATIGRDMFCDSSQASGVMTRAVSAKPSNRRSCHGSIRLCGGEIRR